MNVKLLVGLVAATALVLTALPGLAAPAEAANVTDADDPAPAGDDRSEAADHADDAGPPSFLNDVTPEFLGDLLDGLPVPDFVASAFGATGSA